MNVSASEPSIAPSLGKAIRFRELKPLWPNDAASTEFVLPFYKYCDSAQPQMARGVPAGAESEELRLVTGVCQPGHGMPLHHHSGEELMFAASGSWLIYFDAAEQTRVYLEPWDAILIPGGVERGWRNVGRETGCLLNISSVTDKMTLVPAPSPAESLPG
jgi:quercetin dioxygenase-like cupin family protein